MESQAQKTDGRTNRSSRISDKKECDKKVDNTPVAVTGEEISNATRYGGWAVDEFIAELSLGFRLGNVVKYISRAGKKNGSTVIDDLKKARVYLDRHISRLENGQK